jgi:hypothetical protein
MAGEELGEEPIEEAEEEGKNIVDKGRETIDNVKNAKEKYGQAKDIGKKIGKGFGKKAKTKVAEEGAKKVAATGARAVASNAIRAVGSAALKAIGVVSGIEILPYIVGAIVIIIGIGIIIMIVIWILWLMNGGAGQSIYLSAGDPNTGANKAIYSEMKTLIDEGKIIAPDKSPNATDPSEKDFLLGAKNPVGGGYIDIRLLKSLTYLGEQHEMIHVSHILYPYVYMPIGTIETKNTKDQQFQKSISAHKDGKAADIDQIDYIYKQSTGCADKSCSKNNVIYYYNNDALKVCQPVCTDLGQGNKGQVCATNVAMCTDSKTCTDKIPIQVSWQDDSGSMNSIIGGISRNAGIGTIEQELGLNSGDLTGNNLSTNINNSGQSALEQYLQLNHGSMSGNNFNQVVQNMGLGQLNTKSGFPQLPAGVMPTNLTNYLQSGGQSQLENILNTPANSLGGQNLNAISANLGKIQSEKELGLPVGTLSNPSQTNKYMQLKFGSSQNSDLTSIATSLNLPGNSFVDLINQAETGQDQTNSLQQIGSAFMSHSFGFPDNVLNGYINSPNQNGFQMPTNYNSATQQSYWSQLTNIENQNGLTSGSLKNLLNTFASGGNPNPIYQQTGSQIMGSNLGFSPNVLLNISQGNLSLTNALNQASMTEGDLSSKIGISDSVTSQMFNSNSSNMQPAILQMGQTNFSNNFGVPYDILGNYMSGAINFNTLQSQSGVNFTNLASQWGFPSNSLSTLVSGNPQSAYQSIGFQNYENNFGLTSNQLTSAINLSNSGNLQGAINAFGNNNVFSSIAGSYGLPTNLIPSIMNSGENPLGMINLGNTSSLGGGLGGTNFSSIPGLGSCIDSQKKAIAQEKVHIVIKQLMQMPSSTNSTLGLPDIINMRLTQLMTWSYNRDVLPFINGSEKPSYQDVYGNQSLPNYGLFATTDNNYLLDHIHLGY